MSVGQSLVDKADWWRVFRVTNVKRPSVAQRYLHCAQVVRRDGAHVGGLPFAGLQRRLAQDFIRISAGCKLQWKTGRRGGAKKDRERPPTPQPTAPQRRTLMTL